jgi:hypothetical protein
VQVQIANLIVPRRPSAGANRRFPPDHEGEQAG